MSLHVLACPCSSSSRFSCSPHLSSMCFCPLTLWLPHLSPSIRASALFEPCSRDSYHYAQLSPPALPFPSPLPLTHHPCHLQCSHYSLECPQNYVILTLTNKAGTQNARMGGQMDVWEARRTSNAKERATETDMDGGWMVARGEGRGREPRKLIK